MKHATHSLGAKMAGRFPTNLHIAEILHGQFAPMIRRTIYGELTPIQRERAPHDVRRFDLTLPDGRVYRVRVSDITPEKETVT